MSYRQAAVDISKEENSRVIMRVNTDIENEQGQYFIPEQVDEQGAKQQTQKQEQDTPSQHARLSHKRTIDLKQEEDLPKFKEQLQELPPHDFIPLISDLSDFINKRYDEVKRSSSQYKYYAKILFQALIYLSTILELIFTLQYGNKNNIDGSYKGLYFFSISITIFIHVFVWIYTYQYMKIEKNHICLDILNYIHYTIVGLLSYLKLLPFIMFYLRDTSIKQFSFSQINKYLFLTDDDRQGNPSGLFKQRTKPVNIFRDLIFHRLALISMMITLLTQTIPMIFIQGFFNGETKGDQWSSFNTFNYFLLLANLIYYLIELQFIVFTTSYRQILVDIQEKLHKIKIQKIYETKQLLKADYAYLEAVRSFYFHIDTSKFTQFDKRRCIIQIIKFILRFRSLKFVDISYIDSYEPVTLQYLANALKLLDIKEVRLMYLEEEQKNAIQSIFEGISNIKFVQIETIDLIEQWNLDKDEEEKSQINRRTVFIQNKRQTTAISKIIKNNTNIQISTTFFQFIPQNLQMSVKKQKTINKSLSQSQNKLQIKFESLETINKTSEEEINSITTKSLLEEKLGYFNRLANCYDYYDKIKKMDKFQAILQSATSFINLTFQIMQYVYFISVEKDKLIWALIILQIFNPILQLLSFSIFYVKLTKNQPLTKQISVIILFVIFNLLKIWDLVMKIIFICFKGLIQDVAMGFTSNAYKKFKSYAAKFKGTIGIVVFKDNSEAINPDSLWAISKSPFYQAVMWRTSVDEALNKIPQFFIYILTPKKDYAWGFSLISSIKDGILAVKDLLSVVIKDFFVPALILRTISVSQFFQSMAYLSSIQDSIFLEYPKSFAVVSKLEKEDLNLFTYRINFTKLDYSYFGPQKKRKLMAQLRWVLTSITTSIEIEQAQRLISLNTELVTIFSCLRVSELQSLKLNFYLDEIDEDNVKYFDIILQNCPKKKLSLLQIQVESRKAIPLSFQVERKGILTGLAFSYYQIREIINQKKIYTAETIQLNEKFLILDRYDFKEFYLEVGEFMNLKDCDKFLNKFNVLENINIKIQCDSPEQIFDFQANFNSPNLKALDLTFENLRINTKLYNLYNVRDFKLYLINCQYNIEDLERLILTIKSGNITIDMRQSNLKFTFDQFQTIQNTLEQIKVKALIYM